jgi:pSer/pThr/pTyr-binding forkhead associated (FHA) protein
MNIFCPHCGSQIQIKGNTAPKVAIVCEFCGSDLTDHLKTIGNAQPVEDIGDPSPDEHGQLPNYNDLPAFPVSQISRPNIPSNQPSGATQMQTQMPFPTAAKQITGPYIKILQINQNIPIPTTEKEFHFGRNTIYNLFNPMQYDVEWLNSISRVQKNDRGQVEREHFIIYIQSGGKYSIEDKNSRWGTWVNKSQIKGKGKIAIKNGDKIELILFKPGNKSVFPFVIEFHC